MPGGAQYPLVVTYANMILTTHDWRNFRTDFGRLVHVGTNAMPSTAETLYHVKHATPHMYSVKDPPHRELC